MTSVGNLLKKLQIAFRLDGFGIYRAQKNALTELFGLIIAYRMGWVWGKTKGRPVFWAYIQKSFRRTTV